MAEMVSTSATNPCDINITDALFFSLQVVANLAWAVRALAFSHHALRYNADKMGQKPSLQE